MTRLVKMFSQTIILCSGVQKMLCTQKYNSERHAPCNTNMYLMHIKRIEGSHQSKNSSSVLKRVTLHLSIENNMLSSSEQSQEATKLIHRILTDLFNKSERPKIQLRDKSRNAFISFFPTVSKHWNNITQGYKHLYSRRQRTIQSKNLRPTYPVALHFTNKRLREERGGGEQGIKA